MILRRRVTELKPYPGITGVLPGQAIATLAGQLSVNGLSKALIVDEEGTVLIGNRTLLAAQYLGATHLNVDVKADLSQDTKNQLNLYDFTRLVPAQPGARIVIELAGELPD